MSVLLYSADTASSAANDISDNEREQSPLPADNSPRFNGQHGSKSSIDIDLPPFSTAMYEAMRSVTMPRDLKRTTTPSFKDDSMDGKQLVELAQIVSCELINLESSDNVVTRYDPSGSTQLAMAFLKTLSTMFPGIRQCNIQDCAELEGKPSGSVGGFQKPLPRRQDTQTSHAITTTPETFPVPVPDLRVRRRDMDMDISATAMNFWEELGLAPISGSKDVACFCIIPFPTFRNGADIFLKSLSGIYSSLKLGSHVIGNESRVVDQWGVLEVCVQAPSFDEWAEDLDECCLTLGENGRSAALLCVY